MKLPFTILITEHDPNDLWLFERAMHKCDATANIQHARNGEEVIQYLLGEGEFSDRQAHPLPGP